MTELAVPVAFGPATELFDWSRGPARGVDVEGRSMTAGTGPLQGIRILDLSIAPTGPLRGALLADQGAEVIKVERPGIGDIGRWVGVSVNGMSALYPGVQPREALHRGRRADRRGS